MKRLPPEMRDWYFPFDWDVSRLWALDLPEERRTLSELRWHLFIPIWSVRRGMHFDLCPADVLEHPDRHPRHDRRIDEADLAYPLDLMFTAGRLAILDGVHRLAKHERLGLEDVRVRIVPPELLPAFTQE